jgi:LPXTG-site transpeptidase (sortase) family protein
VARKYKIGSGIQNTNNRKRWFLLACLICLICLSGLVRSKYVVSKPSAVHAIYTSPPHKEVSLPPKTTNYGLPVRLKISKLDIDAPITYMGLTKTGTMAVPPNITDVGWYKNGSLPGSKGSAVLAGHVDGLKGQPGVFFGLDKLQKGDFLQVIDSNNTAISFTVREARTYGQDEQPSEVFNATDGVHLNLITCTGTWDKDQHRFLQRLVVFADKSS